VGGRSLPQWLLLTACRGRVKNQGWSRGGERPKAPALLDHEKKKIEGEGRGEAGRGGGKDGLFTKHGKEDRALGELEIWEEACIFYGMVEGEYKVPQYIGAGAKVRGKSEGIQILVSKKKNSQVSSGLCRRTQRREIFLGTPGIDGGGTGCAVENAPHARARAPFSSTKRGGVDKIPREKTRGVHGL